MAEVSYSGTTFASTAVVVGFANKVPSAHKVGRLLINMTYFQVSK